MKITWQTHGNEAVDLFSLDGHLVRDTRRPQEACRIYAQHIHHAGGPSHTNEAMAPSDSVVEPTNAAVAPAVATDDDDDDDGDGDPDSDRAHHIPIVFSQTAKLQTWPVSLRRTAVDRILRMPELKSRIGLSRSTIYEAIKNNEFPSSVSLGPRAVGWLESDIDKWLDSRISSRKPL